MVLDDGNELGGERTRDGGVELGRAAFFIPDDADAVRTGLRDLGEFGRAVFTLRPHDHFVHAAQHDLFVAAVVEEPPIDVKGAARAAAGGWAAGATAARGCVAGAAPTRRGA